jgi:hypothetical protein
MILPWNARDIYGCLNPGCRSRVLILRSSVNQVARPRVPRCMCGGFLTPDSTPRADHDRGMPIPDRPRAAGNDSLGSD